MGSAIAQPTPPPTTQTFFKPLNLGGFAQGADEVVDSLALFQRVQLHGAGTHHLEDDGNRTGLAVETGDGQGNALGIFLRADNDELTGLCLLLRSTVL